MHHGMSPVDELELVVVPGGPFRALRGAPRGLVEQDVGRAAGGTLEDGARGGLARGAARGSRSSVSPPAFEARYVLVGLPALPLAIGAAVASILRSWALAVGVALALSAVVRLGQRYWTPGEGLIR
jgi:hypothetical protein